MDAGIMSRREVLQRLAAVGLVITGCGLAPAITGAKESGHRKSTHRARRDTRQTHELDETEEERHDRGNTTRAGVAAKVNIIDMADPEFFALPGKTKILSIDDHSLTNDWRVTVQGNVTFNREQVALMRLGREFRVRCEIWGEDSGCAAPSDLLFKLVKPKEFIVYNKTMLASTTTVLKKPFFFQDRAPASKLDEDRNTLLDFCNDNLDDIAAHLFVETRINNRSTTKWQPMSEKVTAQVQDFF